MRLSLGKRIASCPPSKAGHPGNICAAAEICPIQLIFLLNVDLCVQARIQFGIMNISYFSDGINGRNDSDENSRSDCSRPEELLSQRLRDTVYRVARYRMFRSIHTATPPNDRILVCDEPHSRNKRRKKSFGLTHERMWRANAFMFAVVRAHTPLRLCIVK